MNAEPTAQGRRHGPGSRGLPGAAAIAEVFADTPDVLRPLIEATVSGLISSLIGHLARQSDTITAESAAAITAALQDAAAQALADAIPGIAAEPAPPAPAVDRSESLAKARAAQAAAEQRTCEICGRVGTRRYLQTGTGWRCSPSATKCPGNRTFPPPPEPEPAQTVPATPIDVPEPPAAEPPKPPPSPASGPTVTARCQDCTRTWILTGRVLDQAIAMHEIKHGHIVTNHEIAPS